MPHPLFSTFDDSTLRLDIFNQLEAYHLSPSSILRSPHIELLQPSAASCRSQARFKLPPPISRGIGFLPIEYTRQTSDLIAHHEFAKGVGVMSKTGSGIELGIHAFCQCDLPSSRLPAFSTSMSADTCCSIQRLIFEHTYTGYLSRVEASPFAQQRSICFLDWAHGDLKSRRERY